MTCWRLFWRRFWFYWLLAFGGSWVVFEGASIIVAHLTGARDLADYTLSDTIRRWSYGERWLAPLVVGLACGLLWHFFGQQNEAD